MTTRVLVIALLFALGGSTWAEASGGVPIPTKTVRIYNNTEIPIYAVIETSATATDEWLQAYFQVTNVNRDRYAHKKAYRVYINPQQGIPPGGSVAITVPFYSQLARTPDPEKPDQYINWWNGGRIYIYDLRKGLVDNLRKDSKNARVDPLTEGITCRDRSPCEPLRIFQSDEILPLNDPSTLTEYTFADAITTYGPPYELHTKFVGYNISYVDFIYLPVAMAPIPSGNARPVGYVGSVETLSAFRAILRSWLTTVPGWPIFIGIPRSTPKIPGAYKAFIGGPDITTPGTTLDNMRSLFKTCTTTANASPTCVTIRKVNDLFQRNYQKYTRLDCDHKALTDELLLQHVYGWVPFNENCTKNLNDLKETPGFDDAKKEYIDLQYRPNFNPYTQLIHNKDFLDMDAYAFSIDDAVGYQHHPGDGLIMTVGGTKGLLNKIRFNRKKVVTVALGSDPKRPQWKHYGICTDKLDQDIDPQHPAFPLNNVDYPCLISVSDDKGRVYTFKAETGPPDPATVECRNSVSPAWCQQINASQNEMDQWTFNTPPPDP